MIRRQMNCADNNCSKLRSSEEERELREGPVTEAVLKEWELTLGLKNGDLHLRERPGCV